MTEPADRETLELLDQLFGRRGAPVEETPADRRNVVPREGCSPPPGPLTADTVRRDFARRLFDPAYAQTEPRPE